MIRSLLQMLGVSRDGANRGDSQGPAPSPTDATGQPSLSLDSLGQTLIATIIDPELTAPKVAEINAYLQDRVGAGNAATNLVVDLQNVEYLDSACLYMLVNLLRRIREAGGRIAIASVRNRVEGVFKLTRLDKLFPIRHNVIDAIEAVERAA